ncbi:NAD(P)H dehydrogenase (Quinone) [Flavobacterium sp. 9AF]|uniref:SDR family oxidoreductase n=1 Tax=Flavobacterium sp. 9AF TaxID=2653142 RepID=UPI0012F2A542|nr:SDR family oxidoreductase [Flavobacterium sp. 9AF]VXB58783.1 NAD(P)H dehydrogenase (Quinone) [Flavobacterium sp. 9AF]
MNNKILITGATGGLGSKVINLLKQNVASKNLVVLVRDLDNELVNQYKNDGLELRIGDYANFESLENAFKDIDTLYFVSAGDDNNRSELHKNVVDVAKKVGIKHILYTSGVRKNESNVSPIATLIASHIQTENFIKDSGINYTIFRHNLYAEVIEMLIGDKNQLVKNKAIYLPTSNGITSFVPKDDLAEAEVKVILNPYLYLNKTLEFNGSESISFSEIAKNLSKILKVTIEYNSPEVPEFVNTMNRFGVPNHIIEMLSSFSLAIAQGEFDHQTNDLEMILGRKTKTIYDFLKQTYE